MQLDPLYNNYNKEAMKVESIQSYTFYGIDCRHSHMCSDARSHRCYSCKHNRTKQVPKKSFYEEA